MLSLLLAASVALASPTVNRHNVRNLETRTPQATEQLLGNVQDGYLNRDSCGSSKIGNRAFWTCRDTQFFTSSGEVDDSHLFSSSASWTNNNADGSPALINGVLSQYGHITGQPFFPYMSEDCGSSSAGDCGDGTRVVIWPDSPPLVVPTASDGTLGGYTWIRRFRIKGDLSTVNNDPATALYKITVPPSMQSSTTDDLPSVSIVNGAFWSQGQIPYGNYGNVVRNGVAYLYGKPSSNVVSLAKVPANAIEDKSQYQYYVDGKWTSTMPAQSASSSSIGIPNATAGGQGTYYYSDAWNSYVWIGSTQYPGAEFYVTTAPAPEGPWAAPTKFYTGQNGNYSLGAYSVQANTALVPSGKNEIYVTYTKNDLPPDNRNLYHTPLIQVNWE